MAAVLRRGSRMQLRSPDSAAIVVAVTTLLALLRKGNEIYQSLNCYTKTMGLNVPFPVLVLMFTVYSFLYSVFR